jgi:hypothetical protein
MNSCISLGNTIGRESIFSQSLIFQTKHSPKHSFKADVGQILCHGFGKNKNIFLKKELKKNQWVDVKLRLIMTGLHRFQANPLNLGLKQYTKAPITIVASDAPGNNFSL